MTPLAPSFRILLFEPIHEAGARLLREAGEAVLAPALDEATLLTAVGKVDALVIRNGGAVSRRVIAAAPRLKVIGRHGSGLDTIDMEAAAERGIRVVYTPEANCESVAEHFVGMALILSKRMLEADRALRAGAWEARHCIGREQLRTMRPTAYLINLGRGPLWDETAVLEALDRGWIAGAGSDVFEREPADREQPLFRHARFVGTPHMSAHTDEAMRRMSLVAEDVIAVLQGREPRWPAN